MAVASVDCTVQTELAQRFQIRSIPTLALFLDGQLAARHSGAFTSAAQIERWARSHAAQPAHH